MNNTITKNPIKVGHNLQKVDFVYYALLPFFMMALFIMQIAAFSANLFKLLKRIAPFVFLVFITLFGMRSCLNAYEYEYNQQQIQSIKLQTLAE